MGDAWVHETPLSAASRQALRTDFGLLPESGKVAASFLASALINLSVLSLVLYVGMTARRGIEEHKYEQTELIFPITPPSIKIKLPQPHKIEVPAAEQVRLEPPKIVLPKLDRKPDVSSIQMETRVTAPLIRGAKPSIILAPQPKAALNAAAPAQAPEAHPSIAPVHLGETFGVTLNPNASKPSTIAAIGNPYGGLQGPATAPRGVVSSAGIGNGTRAAANAGMSGEVASTAISHQSAGLGTGAYRSGKVGSAEIPEMQAATPVAPPTAPREMSTHLEVLSKPPVQYTSEARELRIEGDVVLRATFTADGQVFILRVVHGLGHGLDEEARRVAEQIRFRPATRDGQAVDLTTNITITFQLAEGNKGR